MSRRTVSRFSATFLLAAAFAVPAAAQTPNPWRVSSAPEAVKLRAGGLSFTLPPLVEIDVDFGPANPVASPNRVKGVVEVECRVARLARVAPRSCANDFEVFVGPIDPTAMPGQVLRPVVAPPCCAFDCPQRLTPVSGTAPMPRPTDAPACGVSNLSWTYTGPGVATWQANPTFPIHPDLQARLVVVEPAAPQACCNEAGSKLAGTWYRDLDGAVLSAAFSKDELKLCLNQNAEGRKVGVTLTAEYAVTKEGLVHGVITGADADMKGDPEAGPLPVGVEMTEEMAKLQELVDCPFSFRVKQTSAGVMVSGLKVGCPGMSQRECNMMCGMYKPAADGKVPAPKPTKAGVYRAAPCCGLGRCEAYAEATMTLPSPHHLQHYPQYFPPDPAFPLQREPASWEAPQCVPNGVCPNPVPVVPPLHAPGCGPCPVPCPQAVMPGWNPQPAPNVPAVEFGMMAEVFGQMIGMNPTYTLPQPLVAPRPMIETVGGCLPPPTVAGVYVPPHMPPAAFPAPPPPPPPASAVRVTTPLPPTPTTKSGPVGTWVREVGPVVYVVKIESDHLTITATAAMEAEDGRVVSEGMVITADYHLGRDGTTLVGLVTGVDATLDGQLPEGANLSELGNELERVQKALTDQPIAMTMRVYGDVLMIGNVRLPQVEGGHGGLSPVAVVGGRYKAVAEGKALPKPKPAKVSVPRNFDGPWQPPTYVPGPPCPVPGFGAPPVVVPPPGVVPRELDKVTLPPGDLIPPTNCLPATPAVRTAAPTPPAVGSDLPPAPADAPKPGKKGKKKAASGAINQYAPEPNVRMERLLNQPEGSGPGGSGWQQFQDAWRKFWFDDQPSHLPPERIHGGIM